MAERLCAVCGRVIERLRVGAPPRYCAACAGRVYREKQVERERQRTGGGTRAQWAEARAAYRQIIAERRA